MSFPKIPSQQEMLDAWTAAAMAAASTGAPIGKVRDAFEKLHTNTWDLNPGESKFMPRPRHHGKRMNVYTTPTSPKVAGAKPDLIVMDEYAEISSDKWDALSNVKRGVDSACDEATRQMIEEVVKRELAKNPNEFNWSVTKSVTPDSPIGAQDPDVVGSW